MGVVGCGYLGLGMRGVGTTATAPTRSRVWVPCRRSAGVLVRIALTVIDLRSA